MRISHSPVNFSGRGGGCPRPNDSGTNCRALSFRSHPDRGRTPGTQSQILKRLNDKSFRLTTLGGLGLGAPDGRADASAEPHRQKLVLLAVLAVSGRPLTRDALIAMFWGDQDEGRARHSLSNALSYLRRLLGRGARPIGTTSPSNPPRP